MIRFLSALVLATATTLCSAAGDPLPLASNAPDRHVVVRGDTLWGIAGKFLKDPWRWPEIWRLNKEQVKNPHRIYPGDVIVLERDADGRPRLSLQSGPKRLQPKVYVEENTQEIPTIPTNIINPFLSSPLIIEEKDFVSAPRIVATPGDRVYLGNGDTAYVTGADPKIEKWSVYRPGRPVLDPDSKDVLGLEAYYLGTAEQQTPGNPAIFSIVTAKEEISRGDRLIENKQPPLISYAPHKPDVSVNGRIVSIYGGVREGGKSSVALLNQGSEAGLEVGHVLAIKSNRTFEQRDENDRLEIVKAPPERIGLLMVFRIFDRMAYGIILETRGPVAINDYVATPE